MIKRTYQKQTWDEWLLCAKDYFHLHGDLLIPASYQTHDGFRLGRWIERQRAIHNGVLSGSLSQDQTAALERIGMVWKLEERLEWAQWLSLAREYLEQHGDLHIPTDYRIRNHRLGYWIKEQRKKYKAKQLNEKQVQELNRLGMIWSHHERRRWDDWYVLAEQYYRIHGNLIVPAGYRTPEGDKLGIWIFMQRERYSGKGNRKPLTREQIDLLNRLSMIWSLASKRDAQWEIMCRWVSAYLKQNGRLPLRPRLTAPDGRSMGNWISTQRTALGAGRLPPDKAERLQALGIAPFGHYKKEAV